MSTPPAAVSASNNVAEPGTSWRPGLATAPVTRMPILRMPSRDTKASWADMVTLDFRLDLPAQIPQGPARRRQRPQLIDDHIAIAVHRIAAVAVVFAAMDRDPDLITGSKKIVVLRCPEGGSQRGAGSGEYVVAEQPHGFAGTAAEGDLQRAVLTGDRSGVAHGMPDLGLLVRRRRLLRCRSGIAVQAPGSPSGR